MDKNRLKQLKALEKTIGYSFKRKDRLELALTHSSYKNYLKQINPELVHNQDNERLEFLGDTILSFVITKKIFLLFDDLQEGQLSKYRSDLVAKPTLFKIAKQIKLVDFLNTGKSEASGKLKDKSSMLADAVEAIIAAIFLDGGMKNAENFILDFFGKYIDKRKLSQLNKNYKSALQEYSQKKYKTLPIYTTTFKETEFIATVTVKNKRMKKETGTGTKKREAEQKAAKNLLRKLKSKKN